MDFEQFRKDPRRCKPLRLSEEDTPQDLREWRKLELEDQQRQYEEYRVANGEEPAVPIVEKPVMFASEAKFDRNGYQRDYMREYRAKKKAQGK